MPKLMVVNHFFHLIIARRKATVHTVPGSASIDVKTGSPDPADFATTRPLIHWRLLAIRAMFGRPLARCAVKSGRVV
jgi:hypothetical protein